MSRDAQMVRQWNQRWILFVLTLHHLSLLGPRYPICHIAIMPSEDTVGMNHGAWGASSISSRYGKGEGISATPMCRPCVSCRDGRAARNITLAQTAHKMKNKYVDVGLGTWWRNVKLRHAHCTVETPKASIDRVLARPQALLL